VRGLGAALIALALAACAPQSPPLPAAPVAAGPAIRVVAQPVPEGVERPDGRFVWAGGLALTSLDSARLHGLSDLEVSPDLKFIAVSDDGDLVRGRITLDDAGRLSGVADVTLRPLSDAKGQSISGDKLRADAEGLVVWPNGDLMVSFERDHRIWVYPAAGGPPRVAPHPRTSFPDNDGMEALARAPALGANAYLVGREDTRETWICRLSAECRPGFTAPSEGPGALVAARALPGGRWALLLRDFQPLFGNTIQLVITDTAGKPLDRLTIRRPATVDNHEGLAALPRRDGSIRFYVLSDDNFNPAQRSLLVAYDWTPALKR
jgi:hypothetical protein